MTTNGPKPIQDVGGVSDRLIEPGNDQGIEPPVVTGPFGVDAEYLPL
jgi:hypothetical protein